MDNKVIDKPLSTKGMMAEILDTLLKVERELDKNSPAHILVIDAYRTARKSLIDSLPDL